MWLLQIYNHLWLKKHDAKNSWLEKYSSKHNTEKKKKETIWKLILQQKNKMKMKRETFVDEDVWIIFYFLSACSFKLPSTNGLDHKYAPAFPKRPACKICKTKSRKKIISSIFCTFVQANVFIYQNYHILFYFHIFMNLFWIFFKKKSRIAEKMLTRNRLR